MTNADLAALHHSVRIDLILTVEDAAQARRFCPPLWAYAETDADIFAAIEAYRATPAYAAHTAYHEANDRVRAYRIERKSRRAA